jgi:AraC-like DNA-binding protein
LLSNAASSASRTTGFDSDSDADLSLAALASDAGLSRFHFCRAFKESTEHSPHAWLRQHRLKQAMNSLRDTDESIVSIAATLGYSSQTAFAAALRGLMAKPRAIGGGAGVSSNRSTGTAIALAQPQLRSARSSPCPHPTGRRN